MGSELQKWTENHHVAQKWVAETLGRRDAMTGTIVDSLADLLTEVRTITADLVASSRSEMQELRDEGLVETERQGAIDAFRKIMALVGNVHGPVYDVACEQLTALEHWGRRAPGFSNDASNESSPEQGAVSERYGWQVRHGVTCVVCPGCAFTMSAEHVSEGEDRPFYDCPNCGDSFAVAQRGASPSPDAVAIVAQYRAEMVQKAEQAREAGVSDHDHVEHALAAMQISHRLTVSSAGVSLSKGADGSPCVRCGSTPERMAEEHALRVHGVRHLPHDDGAAAPLPNACDALRACWCFRCLDAPELGFENPTARTMILCPACGNKRCPRATDHRFACTGSNEAGQFGSRYGEPITDSRDATADEWKEIAQCLLLAIDSREDVARIREKYGLTKRDAPRSSEPPGRLCASCGATWESHPRPECSGFAEPRTSEAPRRAVREQISEGGTNMRAAGEKPDLVGRASGMAGSCPIEEPSIKRAPVASLGRQAQTADAVATNDPSTAESTLRESLEQAAREGEAARLEASSWSGRNAGSVAYRAALVRGIDPDAQATVDRLAEENMPKGDKFRKLAAKVGELPSGLLASAHARCEACGVDTGSRVSFCMNHWPWRSNREIARALFELEKLRTEADERRRNDAGPDDRWADGVLAAARVLEAEIAQPTPRTLRQIVDTLVALAKNYPRAATERPSEAP